jgi:GNAT superfamily N-acetyltransferase
MTDDENVATFNCCFENVDTVPAPALAVTIDAVDRDQATDVRREILKDPQAFIGKTGDEAILRVHNLTSGSRQLYVARHSGVLLGFLAGQLTRSGFAYTSGVAVAAEHRGRGIGASLWRAFVESAAANGASEARALASPLHRLHGASWQDEWTWMMFHLAVGMTATLEPKFYAGEDRIVLSKPLGA